jgi:hypothetical protein
MVSLRLLCQLRRSSLPLPTQISSRWGLTLLDRWEIGHRVDSHSPLPSNYPHAWQFAKDASSGMSQDLQGQDRARNAAVALRQSYGWRQANARMGSGEGLKSRVESREVESRGPAKQKHFPLLCASAPLREFPLLTLTGMCELRHDPFF